MSSETQTHPVGEVMARAGMADFFARLALGILTWAIVSGVCWLGLFGIDNLLRLPGGLRFPLALCGAIVTLASFWSCVVQRIRNRKTPGEIAVLLEKHYGIDDNVLINSFEFEQAVFGERQRPFIEATLGAGQVGLKDIMLRDLWQPRALAKWGAGLALLFAGWMVYASQPRPYASNALQRYLFSLADVPPVGTLELSVDPDKDVNKAEGDDLQVTVTVGGLEGGVPLPGYPEIIWKEGDAPVEIRPPGLRKWSCSPWPTRPRPMSIPTSLPACAGTSPSACSPRTATAAARRYMCVLLCAFPRGDFF